MVVDSGAANKKQDMRLGTDFSRNEIEVFDKGYRINKNGIVKEHYLILSTKDILTKMI